MTGIDRRSERFAGLGGLDVALGEGGIRPRDQAGLLGGERDRLVGGLLLA